MVKRGFERTATKEDLQPLHEEMATKDGVRAGFDEGLAQGEHLVARLQFIDETIASRDADVLNLQLQQSAFEKRLTRSEEKLGRAK